MAHQNPRIEAFPENRNAFCIRVSTPKTCVKLKAGTIYQIILLSSISPLHDRHFHHHDGNRRKSRSFAEPRGQEVGRSRSGAADPYRATQLLLLWCTTRALQEYIASTTEYPLPWVEAAPDRPRCGFAVKLTPQAGYGWFRSPPSALAARPPRTWSARRSARPGWTRRPDWRSPPGG